MARLHPMEDPRKYFTVKFAGRKTPQLVKVVGWQNPTRKYPKGGYKVLWWKANKCMFGKTYGVVDEYADINTNIDVFGIVERCKPRKRR